MNEEEKKAIEYLKNRLEILHNNTQWATENSIKVVLNLIDKQQKEIEELKELLQGNLYEKYDYYKQLAGSYQANCISKDKIRDKIEELEIDQQINAFIDNGYYEYRPDIKVLKELLEEK